MPPLDQDHWPLQVQVLAVVAAVARLVARLMLTVARQRVPVHWVLADRVDNRVADTVDSRAADTDMPLVDAVEDTVVPAVHKRLGHQQASQEVVRWPPDSGAMCCRNSSSEQIYPSRPIDRERCYIVLHSLGRK